MELKNIKFTGDKFYKDRKLRSVIVSEENKFWKFISKKKYLDISRIELDKRLLKNFGIFSLTLIKGTSCKEFH